MKQTTWHWPDHVIGKRESRRLREEHNALANSHSELVAVLSQLLNSGELMDDKVLTDSTSALCGDGWLALAKAKEAGHE